jgi:integrase
VAEITNEAYKGKKTFYEKTRKEVQEKLHVALKNQLSAGTVRVIHAILFAALKDAVKWKRLAVNVCTVVTLPRLAQSERQPLTKEQALQLLEAANGNRLECLLTLALATGMRLGELLALRWDDMNLEERTLRVAHTARYASGFGMIESEPKTESSK